MNVDSMNGFTTLSRLTLGSVSLLELDDVD